MTKDQIEAWRGALTGLVHLLNKQADGQLRNADKMHGGIQELCDLAIKGCARPEALHKWIPVSERKPSANDGRILILIADKRVAIENLVTGGHIDLSGNWWAGVPGNWDSLKGWEVTHWMPELAAPSAASPLAENRGG